MRKIYLSFLGWLLLASCCREDANVEFNDGMTIVQENRVFVASFYKIKETVNLYSPLFVFVGVSGFNDSEEARPVISSNERVVTLFSNRFELTSDTNMVVFYDEGEILTVLKQSWSAEGFSNQDLRRICRKFP